MTEQVQHARAAATAEGTTEFRPVKIGRCFTMTPSGLEVHGEPTFEESQAMWDALRTLDACLQFCIGDAVRYLEERWGERASQIMDATGLSLSTVRTYGWVAKQVPAPNRMMDRGLTYAHHQAVAGMPEAEQRRWLGRALGEGDGERWTVARLKKAVSNGEDQAESGWYLIVDCLGPRKREALRKKLELEGYPCSESTRRGSRREDA